MASATERLASAVDIEVGSLLEPSHDGDQEEDKLGSRRGLIPVGNFPWHLREFSRASPLCHLALWLVFVVHVLKFEQSNSTP